MADTFPLLSLSLALPFAWPSHLYFLSFHSSMSSLYLFLFTSAKLHWTISFSSRILSLFLRFLPLHSSWLWSPFYPFSSTRLKMIGDNHLCRSFSLSLCTRLLPSIWSIKEKNKRRKKRKMYDRSSKMTEKEEITFQSTLICSGRFRQVLKILKGQQLYMVGH